jgi:hypothetical protein
VPQVSVSHRRVTRTTNLLERLFGEERLRLKIIPNGFGGKPVLKPLFGAPIHATEQWRGLRFLARVTHQLSEPPSERFNLPLLTITRGDSRVTERQLGAFVWRSASSQRRRRKPGVLRASRQKYAREGSFFRFSVRDCSEWTVDMSRPTRLSHQVAITASASGTSGASIGRRAASTR